MIDACEGVVVEAWEIACLKRMPPDASRSKLGVRMRAWPYELK